MRIVVDFDKCKSNAVCMGIAPDVFEVRDDGFLRLVPGHEDRVDDAHVPGRHEVTQQRTDTGQDIHLAY